MRLRLWLAVIGTGLLVAAASPAAARPGGGGSYQGGGGGGGGSRGGGSFSSPVGPPGTEGGVPLGPVGSLVILGVLAGVIVLVLVARNRQKGGAQAQQFDAGFQSRASASLAPLQARDPQLTDAGVNAHVRQMSEQLSAAWCAGDMRPARPFVSDGVYSRFQVQLALMQQENRRNVMSETKILASTIEAVDDARPLDVLHVRFTAVARDTEVTWQASQGEIQQALAGARANPYTEIWTLVRLTGAQSKPDGFQVGRACPSCGAPLEAGETIKCKYCGALVCSGEHDWVLSEITQLVEWRPTQARPAGLGVLRRADPAVAAEVLEDRASYLFWKWVQAGRAGSAAPLRKCAAPAFVAAGGMAQATQGASDVAVGGAQIVGCTVDNPDRFDRVDVLVLWSARFGGASQATPRRTIVRMARRTGVQSKLSMTALVCQSCGAPLTESDSTKCDRCGAELAAGDQAWVLEGVAEA